MDATDEPNDGERLSVTSHSGHRFVFQTWEKRLDASRVSPIRHPLIQRSSTWKND